MAKDTVVHIEATVTKLTRAGLIAALKKGECVVADVARFVISDAKGGVELCGETDCRFRDKPGVLVRGAFSGEVVVQTNKLRTCGVHGCTPCGAKRRPSLSWGG